MFIVLFCALATTESPLYVRAHSKSVLTMAITNDTELLSANKVMDYSLLVGQDQVTGELIVGIIGNYFKLATLFR